MGSLRSNETPRHVLVHICLLFIELSGLGFSFSLSWAAPQKPIRVVCFSEYISYICIAANRFPNRNDLRTFYLGLEFQTGGQSLMAAEAVDITAESKEGTRGQE